MPKRIITLLVLLIASVCGAGSAVAYDFPYENPYLATILGTPEEFRPELPERMRIRKLKLPLDEAREVPELFWYENGLRYQLAQQREKAPLIFVIAGTGGGYNTAKNREMMRAFYSVGFHVVTLPSPTHPSLLITESRSRVPGHLMEDSADLYRIMQQVWEQVRDRIEVSEFYVTGYSLGGAQAAVISMLDEDQGHFNFRKVLMINPPVSLYNSIVILDDMLESNIPGGLNNFNAFFEEMYAAIVEEYQSADFIEFSPEFFYDIYQRRDVPDEKLKALIGLAFRLSSGSMIFTSDVMTDSGYIAPPGSRLTFRHSLTDLFKVSMRVSFQDYVNEYFIPYFQRQRAGLTRDELIHEASLKNIEDYLEKSTKIGVIHNEDDFILAPGELDFFRRIFGERAKIFPKGGHCGNMEHRDNVAWMLDFFTGESERAQQ